MNDWSMLRLTKLDGCVINAGVPLDVERRLSVLMPGSSGLLLSALGVIVSSWPSMVDGAELWLDPLTLPDLLAIHLARLLAQSRRHAISFTSARAQILTYVCT